MVQLSWILIITVLAAGFALFDAIARLRGRRGANVLAIVELVAAVLMLIAIFLPFPALAGVSASLLFAIILEVVLLIVLFAGGRGKGVSTITIIALVLNTIVVVLALGWVQIPAIQ